ncbi:FYVE-domain-containing protein [Byssothecium circinans]|uniref:FYVE-domain-containing protein n=1 Tax=Byssothecium circinans TaxID=147558 RepID=A0A6A5TJM5_9PLEO|nr:FYVE-domain-containing protein [Byssothecium circinans]
MSPTSPATAPLFAQPSYNSSDSDGGESETDLHDYPVRSLLPSSDTRSEDTVGNMEGSGNVGQEFGAGGNDQAAWDQHQQADGAYQSSVGSLADGGSVNDSGHGVNESTGYPANQSHDQFLAQLNSTYGGQTWIDFLRDSDSAGYNAGNEATNNHPFNARPRSTENPLPPLPGEHLGPHRLYQQPQHTYSFQEYLHHQPHQQLPPPIRHTHSASASVSNPRFPLPPLPPRGQRPGPERRGSSDRKRRLTTADSPIRRPPSSMRTPSSSGAALGPPGASSLDPAILGSGPSIPASALPSRTTSLRPPMPPGFGSHGSGGENTRALRRESDLVLPRWQPDHEVSHCFVCGSQFTFFYRKHHCRKCGKVVCAACSPHRITIPRQFIVHPPNENPNMVDLTSDDEENTMSPFGPFRNPALGGGEEVRVCNPCVPDPNYSPPPPYTLNQTPYPLQFSHTAHPGQRVRPRGHRSSQSESDNVNMQTNGSRNSNGHGQTAGSLTHPSPDGAPTYRYIRRPADLLPPTNAPHNFPGFNQSGFTPLGMNPHATPYIPQQPEPHGSRYSPSTSMFRRGFLSHGVSNAPPPPPPPVPQPTPRREIAEEDECPICGNELPPKGSGNDESARIQHVEDCINMHSSSPPPAAPSNTTSTSLPAQRTRGMSSVGAAGGNGEGASANRNRMSMNLSARGMIVYTATEKDCVDDEGEEAECVICFEEFRVGDRMARLVCFCKFHEKCIQKWWDTKGRGACPTHQLHE